VFGLVENSVNWKSYRQIHCSTSLVTLFLTNDGMRRFPVLWITTAQRDVLVVALDVHVDLVITRTPL